MKRIKVIAAVFCSVFVLASQSFALFHVEGVYSVFPNNQGIGAAIELPMVPLFTTYLHVAQLNEQKIDLPTFDFDGKTFAAGDVTFTGYAAELLFKAPISLFGIDFGINAMVNLLSGEDQNGKMVTLPGNMYGGVFGRYTRDLLPFVAAYVQAGYMAKVVDGEEQIRDEAGVDLDLSDLDMSGLRYGIGLSIGF